MKTEFVDVSETRKHLVVEIPRDVVEEAIERLAREYSRAARVPGFRPGKVPPRIVRQRFKEQILHDVAHELIPRAIDEALRERSIEPVDTPDVRDVVVEEGQPLTFTAAFETVPPIDPGDCKGIRLHRPGSKVDEEAVNQALENLRERSARYEPVTDRAIEPGDTVSLDLERRAIKDGEPGETDRHENVSVEIGSAVNPPGFDEEMTGLRANDVKTFTVHYPADYAIADLAGTDVEHKVTIRAIRRRIVPDLDDEFARDLGSFENLEQLRERVRSDLEREAEREADRQLRAELMKTLASRVSFEAPEALVAREVERRIEDFVRGLVQQRVDPRRANIDWEAFRASQREPAAEAVRAALVLDEIARREGLAATPEDVEREVASYAERSGRTVSAIRAELEKEGAVTRLEAGLRREKAIDFVLACATIETV